MEDEQEIVYDLSLSNGATSDDVEWPPNLHFNAAILFNVKQEYWRRYESRRSSKS